MPYPAKPFKESLLAVAVTSSLALNASQIQAVELTPNPNPVGSIITNTATIDQNSTFANDGEVVNGDITGNGVINNNSYLGNNPTGVINNSANGTINNDGALGNYGGGTINNAGEINNNYAFGNYLGGTINNTNNGVVNNNAYLVNYAGTINNNSNGIINNNYAIYNYAGSINNTAEINNNSNSFLDNYGAGILNNDNGVITNYDAGIYNGPASTISNKNGNIINSQSLILNEGLIDNAAGGSIINDSGFVENFGNIDNSSGIIANHNGGILNNYGTVTGGSLVNNDSALTNYSDYGGSLEVNSLSNESNGIIYNDSQLTINTTTNNIDNAEIQNAYGGVLNNNGNLENSAFLNNYGTINNNQQITNSGLFEIHSTGNVIGNGDFTQTDGETIVNGFLGANTILFTGGGLSGEGELNASNISFDAATEVGPGNSAGTLNLSGSISFDGLLEIELFDSTTFDVLNIDGDIAFGDNSDIVFNFMNSFIPDINDSFDFLNYTGGLTGFDDITYSLVGLPSSFDYEVLNTGSSLRWQVAAIAQVPEPDTLFLFAAGGFIFSALRKRKKLIH